MSLRVAMDGQKKQAKAVPEFALHRSSFCLLSEIVNYRVSGTIFLKHLRVSDLGYN